MDEDEGRRPGLPACPVDAIRRALGGGTIRTASVQSMWKGVRFAGVMNDGDREHFPL